MRQAKAVKEYGVEDLDTIKTIQYKCPNCGGELKFNAEKQKFSCEYCLSDFTEEQIKDVCAKNEGVDLSQNVEEQKAAEEFAEHVNLYTCPSCGAEIISEDTTAATFCYYCHNPVILSGRLSGDYKPNMVIPFSVTKESAREYFKKWCKKRWFIPGSFKNEKQLEKMTGVYVPFWIADCHTDAVLHGKGERTHSWTSGDYRNTKHEVFSVIRRADIDFKGVPADGASKIDDSLMEAIEPFDYGKLKNFSMSYLSGFFADKYDVDKAQVFGRIKGRIVSGANDILRSSVGGYSSFTTELCNADILSTNWQYMMLPVWFMTYKYKGKSYSFAINGQSGKAAGIPPMSWPKLLATCGIVAAAGLIMGILGRLLL